MEGLLGFQVGLWDYITFAAILIIIIFALGVVVFILGLPGRIAIARKHPDAEAVNLMGWLGFMAIVPWMQAFFWAFKPTEVIDIRNMPEEQKRQTDEMIKRIKGEEVKPSSPSDVPKRKGKGKK